MESNKHPERSNDTLNQLNVNNTPPLSIEASQDHQVSREGSQHERIPPSLPPEQPVANDALPMSVEATQDHQMSEESSEYASVPPNLLPEQPIFNECCRQKRKEPKQAWVEIDQGNKEIKKRQKGRNIWETTEKQLTTRVPQRDQHSDGSLGDISSSSSDDSAESTSESGKLAIAAGGASASSDDSAESTSEAGKLAIAAGGASGM